MTWCKIGKIALRTSLRVVHEFRKSQRACSLHLRQFCLEHLRETSPLTSPTEVTIRNEKDCFV